MKIAEFIEFVYNEEEMTQEEIIDQLEEEGIDIEEFIQKIKKIIDDKLN